MCYDKAGRKHFVIEFQLCAFDVLLLHLSINIHILSIIIPDTAGIYHI